MSEEQSDKLKLNLKTTDTNRFKIEADKPTEQPAEKLPQTEAKPAQIDELEAQRKVNTGSFKRVDVTGQAPANAAIAGVGDGGLKKSETVRLKVVRATPAAAPAAGPAASTVKLNLKRPDEAAPAAAAPAPATAPAPTPAQTSTLKLRPTTPAPAESSAAANTATVKVPTTAASATVAVEPPTEAKPAQATVAVEPPTEAAKPALKLNKPKPAAAATVAVEPPPEAKPAEEKKEEPPKPAMKMKGGPYSKDDDVEKYLPQQDDDEPGALEGVAALIAFLGTGFATYQLVMNFLQQIQ